MNSFFFGSSHLPSVLCFSWLTVMLQSHQSPLHSTDESQTERSQLSGGGDVDGAENADGGGDSYDFEDTDGGTDDNTNSRPADPGQGLAGKRQLSPSSPSSDEGLTDAVPNPPGRKRAKHALHTSNCGCVKVCGDFVKMLAQDRKFMAAAGFLPLPCPANAPRQCPRQRRQKAFLIW